MRDTCRLCGAGASFLYAHEVLGKYRVNYFECDGCGSLQTEKPYWLSDAYAFPGVHIDVGQAIRVVRLWLYMTKLLTELNVMAEDVCVDYGGSAGLLTRLMRDSGFNFYSFDAYEKPKYADYFTQTDLSDAKVSIITAFEVFEHFPDPAEELGRLLALAGLIHDGGKMMQRV